MLASWAGEATRNVDGITAHAPPPSRWKLNTIRVTIDWLRDYSLSGVWYVLARCGLKLRLAQVQQHSPDPEYRKKVFACWPEPARDWSATRPIAGRSDTNNQQWRTLDVLNALTGQVTYLDAYIIGRAKLIEFYGQLNQRYRRFETVYVIQDNWSVHQHPEVLQRWPTTCGCNRSGCRPMRLG